MRKPSNIPRGDGVYAVVTLDTVSGKPDGTRVAYVGWCANLQQRANIWEYRFRQVAKGKGTLPAKGLPDFPSDKFGFLIWPGLDGTKGVKKVRAQLESAFFEIINKKSRVREEIEWNGKTATLAEHARDAGMKYAAVYYRLQQGWPLDKVFAKEDPEGS
jgi:hypothetical protein